MSIPYIGDFAEDATVYHYFNTFSSNDPAASVTITDLLLTDLFVYKDGSVTDIVTDGATVAIDFDSRTGIHLITIDTSVHADYSIGSDYMVSMVGTTVDAGTVTAALFTFSIENRYNAAADDLANGTDGLGAIKAETALILADTAVIGAAGAGLTDLGGMSTTMKAQVNTEADTALTDYNGPTSAEFDARTLVAASYFDPAVDTVATVTTVTNQLTAAAIADAVVDETLTAHVTADSVAVALKDILVDTTEIGVAGAGLSNINLPNQTMDIVGSITGNLSGSVGSVTGAVGSVTGAVGSVTGAVGSVTGHTNQTGDSFAIVNGAAGLVAIDTVVDAILVDTAEIGAAGAGLTAVPWNAAWDAEVESEVNDAIDTAIAELGVAAPTATPTLRTGMMLMYMALRNKLVVQTSGTDAIEVYNDAGTKIAAKLITDDGSDYTEAEMA